MLKYVLLLALTVGLCTPVTLSGAVRRKSTQQTEMTHTICIDEEVISIAIPSTYKAACAISSEKIILHEYIPHSENNDTWTSAIAVHQLPTSSRSYNAKSIAYAVLANMFTKFHPFEIMTESSSTLPNGNMQHQLWASYFNPDTAHNEIIFIMYHAGPTCCAGLYYTFRSKNAEVDKEKAATAVKALLSSYKTEYRAASTTPLHRLRV